MPSRCDWTAGVVKLGGIAERSSNRWPRLARARARRTNNITSDFVCFVYFVVHQHPHSIRGDLCSSVVEKTSIAIQDCGSDGTSPSQKIASDSIRGCNKKFDHNRAHARARSVSIVPQSQSCKLHSRPKNGPVATELRSNAMQKPRTPVRGTVQRKCRSREATAGVPPICDHNNSDRHFEHVAAGIPGRATRVAPLGNAVQHF